MSFRVFRRPLGTLVLFSGFALVLLTGCEGNSVGSLYPVSGKILANGKPLTRGTVRLVPDKSKSNTLTLEPYGTIGADGTYTVSTQGKPGAPLGWYKVTIVSTDDPDSTKPLATKSYVAKRYANPDLTTAALEVVQSPAPGAYDLKVAAE